MRVNTLRKPFDGGYKITGDFGEKYADWVIKKYPHLKGKTTDAVDFAMPVGTPLYAPGNGRVDYVDNVNDKNGLGLWIELDNGYRTRLWHLSEIVVNHNQRVGRGELIGYSGNTGYSTGPHLDWALQSPGGDFVDPLDYVADKPKPKPKPEIDWAGFEATLNDLTKISSDLSSVKKALKEFMNKNRG